MADDEPIEPIERIEIDDTDAAVDAFVDAVVDSVADGVFNGLIDDSYDVSDGDDMLVFGESADEETGRRSRSRESVMGALYLRYVAKRENPEEVLDDVFAGWRNLAEWHKNSCHIDVVLDVALWSVAWLNGEYEHVKEEYKKILQFYITKRRIGDVRNAQIVSDDISTRNLNKPIGAFYGANYHIIRMTEAQYFLSASSLTDNVLSVGKVDREKTLYVVELPVNSIRKVDFQQTYVLKDEKNNSFEYVPLAAIIGVPGHFRSALNVTAMAKKLAPGRTIDDPPVWYGFDHYADQEKTEAIPRIGKLVYNENLVVLLLVKV